MSQQHLDQLLAAWNSATGQDVRPRAVERILFELWRADYTPADVTLVVDFLRRQNAKLQGAQFRINIFKVLGDVETFESTRAEAAAMQRNRRPPATPRQQVEALRERPVDPEETRARQTQDTNVRTAFAALKDSLNQIKPGE